MSMASLAVPASARSSWNSSKTSRAADAAARPALGRCSRDDVGCDFCAACCGWASPGWAARAGWDRAAAGRDAGCAGEDDGGDGAAEGVEEGVPPAAGVRVAGYGLSRAGGRGAHVSSGAAPPTGSAGVARLAGAAASDRLTGAAGSDRLTDAAGRDRLTGGAGSDRLTGVVGSARFAGGAGSGRLAGVVGSYVTFSSSRMRSSTGVPSVIPALLTTATSCLRAYAATAMAAMSPYLSAWSGARRSTRARREARDDGPGHPWRKTTSAPCCRSSLSYVENVSG
ncbi:calcium-binding protein [Nonomuraea fuscirosea]|uniref:calcium-binding protein n=1 Tax=Nonomuraea fuscirosea TaxID=1291556 RepID=UPI00389A22B3